MTSYDDYKLASPPEYSEAEMEAADLIRCARCGNWVPVQDLDLNGDCDACVEELSNPDQSRPPKAKE